MSESILNSSDSSTIKPTKLPFETGTPLSILYRAED